MSSNRKLSVFTKLASHSVPRFILVLICSIGLVASPSAQVVITYTYDDLNRLIIMDRDDGPIVDIDYDEVGNITLKAISNSPDTDGDSEGDFADDDDDGDHIPDAVEIANELNPLLAADAVGDLDEDGITNVDEYLLGYDMNHFHGDLGGELSADGKPVVDMADVLLLKRFILKYADPTLDQELPGHGDVNANGKLDAGDLVILKRKALEIQ